ELHSQQAFYVAESGLMRAVAKLNDSALWRQGYNNEQLSNGFYTVIIHDSSTIAGLDDTVIAQSTGSQSGSAATVEGMIVPKYFQPFKYAAFGDDSLKLQNTACTDSYNSDSGTYDETQMFDSASIGSNGEITLQNSADVNGDAITSLNDGITTDREENVLGDTSTTAEEFDMGYVSQEDFDWAEDNSYAPVGFSGSYNYAVGTKTLRLRNDDSLELQSGVYYFSSITLNEGGTITLAPGAKVTIYVVGDLTLNQHSSLNPGGSPGDFIIYSQGSTLNISQHTEFRAAFWGPETNILIENNTEVYGSFIGKSFTMENSACVHYDRSLVKIKGSDVLGMEMIAWKQY
ncbi:MAG: hypothetical protein IIB00_11175, partial [candidate division Zixibacteria bacterium]|nr:hypothetical protein [candidate division Zixibacteria bacterium]